MRGGGRRRIAELEGEGEAHAAARALLAEHGAKLAEAREFLADRQDAIQDLQQQLAQKDAQVGPALLFFCICAVVLTGSQLLMELKQLVIITL